MKAEEWDFGAMSCCEPYHLFYADDQRPDLYGGKRLTEDATPQEVAANIRAFVAVKEGGDRGGMEC